MRKFIKDDVLYQSSTKEKIDVEDNRNHEAYKQIDLAFSAERSLRKARISLQDFIQKRTEWISFLPPTCHAKQKLSQLSKLDI